VNNLAQFISIINSKIGQGFVYGGQSDKPLTKEALQALVDMYGREHYYFDTYSAEKWLGKEYYDCSGLIQYTLKRMGLIPKNSYYSAHMLYYMLCTRINPSQLKTGDLCFYNTPNGIVHAGVYVGNNSITHARNTFSGVINTPILDYFNTFGRLKFFQ
jgi:cell wall-associated NlpC family hydrolase